MFVSDSDGLLVGVGGRMLSSRMLIMRFMRQ